MRNTNKRETAEKT